MRKTLFLFCLLFFSVSLLSAQTSYEYDASGNRISRVIVLPSQPASALQNPPQDTASSPKIYTDKLNENDILIYPNPTQGALAVEIRNMNVQTAYHLEVFSMNGVTVFRQSQVSSYTAINLSGKPKGIYMLRIWCGDRSVTWKIIKE